MILPKNHSRRLFLRRETSNCCPSPSRLPSARSKNSSNHDQNSCTWFFYRIMYHIVTRDPVVGRRSEIIAAKRWELAFRASTFCPTSSIKPTNRYLSYRHG